MGMMLIVGRLGDVQPRYLIAAGSIITGFAMIDLLRMTPDADFWFFAWSRIYLGVGLPLIFIPITHTVRLIAPSRAPLTPLFQNGEGRLRRPCEK
jgi:hypothetical protein